MKMFNTVRNDNKVYQIKKKVHTVKSPKNYDFLNIKKGM